MIHYVKGDLIEAFKNGEVNIIAHGCNCFKCMGGGIARALANEFPVIEKSDFRLELPPKKRLGRVVKLEVDSNKYILNCYTQYKHWGDGVLFDYKAFKRCLRAIWAHMKANVEIQNSVFGIPKIGSGLAGGDWPKIAKIIERTIKGPVYVYELD